MKPLHLGVLQALVYADLFDYPLTLPELHRYTVGVAASLSEVAQAVSPDSPLAPLVHRDGPFVMLAGREELAAVRRARAVHARRLWPRALTYARHLAALPFVRMVAVTGALAVDNVEAEDDLDYLVVTETGYLWLCRALVIGLVRLAAQRGDVLCPNYFLSTAALYLADHSLFTAHELAQMVPVAGLDVYARMRRLNAWTARFLPNAVGPPRTFHAGSRRRFARAAEWALRSPLGRGLERWERTRKIRIFAQQGRGIPEVHFSAHHCKGHFHQHGRRTLEAFQHRWQRVTAALGHPVEMLSL